MVMLIKKHSVKQSDDQRLVEYKPPLRVNGVRHKFVLIDSRGKVTLATKRGRVKIQKDKN